MIRRPFIILAVFIVAAATAGETCYRDGVCISTPPAPPTVRRLANVQGGTVDYGTGSIVFDDGQTALIFTAWHMVRDRVGRLVVCGPAGELEAELFASRPAADLAAWKIPSPGLGYVPLASKSANRGDRVTAAGFGADGTYRTSTGPVIGQMKTTTGAPVLVFRGRIRVGDSGGPIIDRSGKLAGVFWADDNQLAIGPGSTTGRYEVYGTGLADVAAFLAECREKLDAAAWRPSKTEPVLPGPDPYRPADTTPDDEQTEQTDAAWQSDATITNDTAGGLAASSDTTDTAGETPPADPPADTIATDQASSTVSDNPTTPASSSNKATAHAWPSIDLAALLGVVLPIAATAAGVTVGGGTGWVGLRLAIAAFKYLRRRSNQTSSTSSSNQAATSTSSSSNEATLPRLPVDYAKIWADHYEKKAGGNVAHESLKFQLYREAVELLRKGELAPQANGKAIAEALDNWVLSEFFSRIQAFAPSDENVYHEGLMGYLYRLAVQRLREGAIEVLGYEQTADAIENWVRREFARKVLTKGATG